MTMFWPLVVAVAVLATEILWRLPIVANVQAVLACSQRAQRAIRSAHISDHWKERVLLAYARRICLGSVSIFAILMLALLPVFGAGLIYPYGLKGWVEALMQPAAIALLCAVSLGYVWLRHRLARA